MEGSRRSYFLEGIVEKPDLCSRSEGNGSLLRQQRCTLKVLHHLVYTLYGNNNVYAG